VSSAPGYAITHIYRSPFPRCSTIVHLPARALPSSLKDAGAVVVLIRPRGFLGVPRDSMSLDGRSPPPDLTAGVPSSTESVLVLNESGVRPISAEFNGQRVTGLTWPIYANHLVLLEVHQ